MLPPHSAADKLAAIGRGARNNELNATAFALGTMIARGWIGRATVEGRLLDAASALAKDDGIHSVRATIKSGIEAGLKSPHEDLKDRSGFTATGESTRKEAPRTPPPAGEWPEPRPLPDGLLPVEAFDSEFLPASLSPWVNDIADRLQCPPDYVAVAAMTALGAVVGRRVGAAPQGKTEWVEIPNIWGAFIGLPAC
jgi:hypothetical protein